MNERNEHPSLLPVLHVRYSDQQGAGTVIWKLIKQFPGTLVSLTGNMVTIYDPLGDAIEKIRSIT